MQISIKGEGSKLDSICFDMEQGSLKNENENNSGALGWNVHPNWKTLNTVVSLSQKNTMWNTIRSGGGNFASPAPGEQK